MTGPNDPTEPTPTWSAPSPATPAPAPAQLAPVAPTGSTLPPFETPASPVSVAKPAPSRKRGVVDVILVVAAIFAIGGVGFAPGRVTAPASTAAPGGGRFQGGQFPTGNGQGQAGNGQGQAGNGQGGNGQGGPGGFFGAGGGITISGEVTAVSADQLTLKLASGQTITVGLNGSTAYHSQAPATASDVTTGSTVQVQVGRGGGNGAGQGQGGQGGGFTLGAATNVTVVPK